MDEGKHPFDVTVPWCLGCKIQTQANTVMTDWWDKREEQRQNREACAVNAHQCSKDQGGGRQNARAMVPNVTDLNTAIEC